MLSKRKENGRSEMAYLTKVARAMLATRPLLMEQTQKSVVDVGT